MALNNYTSIRDAASRWLNRDGFNEVSDEIEDWMTMAQRRVSRVVRIPPMEVKIELTLDAEGEAEVPTDMLDVKYMVASQGTTSWGVSRSTFLEVKRQQSNTGSPLVFDMEAGKIIFGPSAQSGVLLSMVYYKELEYISSAVSQNWFSQYAPELILYATLIEASIFLADFKKRREYEGEFRKALKRLEEQKRSAEYSGSPLTVKPA